MDANTRMIAGRIGPCPVCGNGRLSSAFDGEETNLLCRECGSCWHLGLGWIDRVNPETCPGCPSRSTCERALYPAGDLLGTAHAVPAPTPSH